MTAELPSWTFEAGATAATACSSRVGFSLKISRSAFLVPESLYIEDRLSVLTRKDDLITRTTQVLSD